MLGDTITINFGGSDRTLTKINQDAYSSEYYYRSTLLSAKILIRHSKAKKGLQTYQRHNVDLTITTFATPTVPEYQNHSYFVFENLEFDTVPFLGFPGIVAWATAATNANLTKLANWES